MQSKGVIFENCFTKALKINYLMIFVMIERYSDDNAVDRDSGKK